MFSTQQLNAIEDAVMAEAARFHLEANKDRIDRVEKFLESLKDELAFIVTAHTAPVQNILGVEWTPAQIEAARNIQEMATRADYLYRSQLAAFVTKTLPKWMQETINAEFPTPEGEAFAHAITDLDPEGFLIDNDKQEDMLQPIYRMGTPKTRRQTKRTRTKQAR